MMTTLLAIGTGAGTLAVTTVSAFATGILGTYTLLHHQQVLAWMRSIRRTDQSNADLDKIDQWLADLYKAQCRLAHKPCRSEDSEEVTQIGTMLRGVADHTPAIAPEPARVVERIEEYVDTALPDSGPAMKVSMPRLAARLGGWSDLRNRASRGLVSEAGERKHGSVTRGEDRQPLDPRGGSMRRHFTTTASCSCASYH
ncbi:hypothetical protein OG885_44130 (plasmid) [Streptomyces sp. NBC_00028]|uniref:hypothetical protein n=1 Tax=Streptomyces sp. NBC_00028 TaxID=2975624 RepID=UPI003245BA77